MTELDILRKNVYDLEKNLHEAYKKISDLTTENELLKKQLFGEPSDGC